MSELDYSLFIIHALSDGAWRVEYRTLNSVHPTSDYSTADEMLKAVAAIVKPVQP